MNESDPNSDGDIKRSDEGRLCNHDVLQQWMNCVNGLRGRSREFRESEPQAQARGHLRQQASFLKNTRALAHLPLTCAGLNVRPHVRQPFNFPPDSLQNFSKIS